MTPTNKPLRFARLLFVLVCMAVVLAACGSTEKKASDRYELAVSYFEEGRIQDARIEAKNTIQIDPKHAKAFLLLGKCEQQIMNWQGAFGGFKTASELDPTLVEAHIGLGRLYLMSKDTEKAQETIDTILALEPNNVDAHVLQAGMLLQLDELDKAEQLLLEILAANPSNTQAAFGLITVYEQMKDLDAAERILLTSLKKNPENTSLLFKAATMTAAQKRYQEAEVYYRKLMEQADDKAPMQLSIVQLHELAGEKDKAEQELITLQQANPDNVEYRLALAGMFLRNGKLDMAESTLKEGTAGDEPDIRLQLALSDVLLEKKDIEQTKTLLHMVADTYLTHPARVSALTKLSYLYLIEKDYPKAFELADQAVQSSPSPAALLLRAKTRLATQDIEGAISDLRIVGTEDEENYEARHLLARAYFEQDSAMMALGELHAILKLNPNHIPSRNLMLQYLASEKQYGTAHTELKTLLDAAPDDPTLLVAMGDLERMRERDRSAVKYYITATKKEGGAGPGFMRLGAMAAAKQDYDAALKYYDSLLEILPESIGGIDRKLFTFVAAGRKGEARSYGQELVAAYPESPFVYEMLGRLAATDNDMAEAEKNFRKAIELAPQWQVPYQRIIEISLVNNDLDKVIAEIKGTLQRNPNAFIEEFLLGHIYQTRGETDLAEQAYLSLLEKRPDMRPAANNLAYLYSQSADPTRLNKGLELATMAAEDGTPEALDTLGWVNHLLGNNEEAAKVLGEAYEKRPEDSVIGYHYAAVLAALGRTVEAKQIANVTLKQGGDFAEKGELEKLASSL